MCILLPLGEIPFICRILISTSHIQSPNIKPGAIAFADLGKLIAKNWKALPDSERAKYNAEANVDKERYQRELEECNANMPVEQKEPAVPGPKIRNKRLGDGVSGGFEKRAKSSNGWPGYQDEGQSAVEQPFGPSSRGPPPYYDPYFGYGRAGAEGYGPPPPPGAFRFSFERSTSLQLSTN